MFALAFILLIISMVGVVLGTSGIMGDASLLTNVLAFLFLLASMAALRGQWEPQTTCFIYPTFSCST